MHSTNSTSASPYAAEAPTAAAVAVATTAAKAAAVATAAAKASEQSAAATEADQTSAAEAATACSSLVISPRLTRVLKKRKAVSTAHLVNINEVHRFTFGTGESLRIAFGVTKSLLFAFGIAYQLHCGFAVGIQCAAELCFALGGNSSSSFAQVRFPFGTTSHQHLAHRDNYSEQFEFGVAVKLHTNSTSYNIKINVLYFKMKSPINSLKKKIMEYS